MTNQLKILLKLIIKSIKRDKSIKDQKKKKLLVQLM